jgi:hypothetical protein
MNALDAGFSGEFSTDPRLVAATVVQHAPGNAGDFVGECRRDDGVMHALGSRLSLGYVLITMHFYVKPSPPLPRGFHVLGFSLT